MMKAIETLMLVQVIQTLTQIMTVGKGGDIGRRRSLNIPSLNMQRPQKGSQPNAPKVLIRRLKE